MATPTAVAKSSSNSNNNPKPVVHAVKPVDPQPLADPQPVEPAKTAPTVAPVQTNELAQAQSEATPDVKKPLTIMIPERLGRRLKLVAQAEGTSVSHLLLSAVEQGLTERFRRAIEILNTDA